MDNFLKALSLFQKQKYAESIKICDLMLKTNPNDQQAWVLKCHALIRKHYIDDLDSEDQNYGDLLLDDDQIAKTTKPGTSLQKPNSQQGGFNPLNRPMSNSGRVSTGYQRVANSRPMSSSQGMRIETALRGQRVGSRLMTSGGRYLRLATASLAMNDDVFLAIDKINMKSIAKKKALANAICEYLLYVEPNLKKALELAADSTIVVNFTDWKWKQRLGIIYFKLGMLREAESQFKSSIKNQAMIRTYLHLAKVYIRMDQPQTALQIYQDALYKYPQEASISLSIARIYDQMNDSEKAILWYRKSLQFDACNFEAIANIASYHFYVDQPEVAMRFYRRLIQLGVNNSEIWNNMGLCCFYNGQFDLFWICFEKALVLSDEMQKSEIWYNLSHVFLNLGEFDNSFNALKVCLTYNTDHYEALNNLGVLESKKKNKKESNYYLNLSQRNPAAFESNYNLALHHFKSFNYQESLTFIKKSLEIYPEHEDSLKLQARINQILVESS